MRPLFFLPLMAACDGLPCGLGNNNEPALGLECDAETRVVTDDEMLALGFTPAQAVAGIEVTNLYRAELEDGSATRISLSLIRADGELEMVDLSDPSTGADKEGCVDYLKVPVDVLAVTSDGSFDLDIRTTVEIVAMDTFSFLASAEIGENLGSFGVEDTAGESSRFRIIQDVTTGAASGEISVFTEGTDGDAVWATSDLVISWASPDE